MKILLLIHHNFNEFFNYTRFYIIFFSSQSFNADGYQRNENDRYPPRNRVSSFNDSFRQEGRFQQQSQSSQRVNRTEGGSQAPRRSGSPFEAKHNSEDDAGVKQTKPRRPSTSEDATKKEENPWERSSRS